MRATRMRSRRLAAAVLAAALLAGCETLERMHDRGGPPPVPPEVLAAADTSAQWVGGDRAGGPVRPLIGIMILWNGFDPRCAELMPGIEAWHEAYAHFGLRIVGLHFAPYPFAADSAAVGATVRRLGLRFTNAVVSEPPPAALAAGRGPVVIWPGGGDPAPQWLSNRSDLEAFDARLRARMRKLHPEVTFASDGPIVREPEAAPARTLFLGTNRVDRGPLRGATADRSQPFVSPFRSDQEGSLETPVPVGWWTPRGDALEAARGGAANYVAIRYDAGPVSLVMAPPAAGAARVWVLEDDRWIAPANAGPDVKFDARGAAYVEVAEPRLFGISRGGRHVLKLSPEAPGVRLYAFTIEAARPRP